jgi:hypothetical protein
MRRLGVVCALALLLAPVSASAMADTDNLNGHFGLGFQIGAPFAITGKYWLSKETALQAYLGTFSHGWNAAGVDWVYEFARIRPSGAPLTFGFHVGVGGIVGFGHGNCFDGFGDHRCGGTDDDVALGVRMPIAANMYLTKVPIEIFLELSPVFEIIPDFDGDLIAALGGRFYF